MLTRRGWTLAAVAVGAFVMAGWFSARALNAVAGPAAVALAAGYLQLRRTPQPELRTETPEYGFAGETATVSLAFDASAPLAATIRLRADDGLAVPDERVETTVADEPVRFDVELRERGLRRVGPVELAVEDVFGLCRRTYRYSASRELVVFPRIHRLTDAGDLAALHRDFGVRGRERFDSLREYERGDPLGDVHWKTSAKRADADLVVMEFEADEQRQRVELLAEADGGRVDDVAEAAASVATYLLDDGLAVGLTVPGGRVEPDTGDDHRTELLVALAHLSAGSVDEARRDHADVLVRGPTDADAVHVTVGGRTVTFGQLSGGAASRSASPAGSSDGSAADGGRPAVTDGGRTATGGGRTATDGGRTAVADDDGGEPR